MLTLTGATAEGDVQEGYRAVRLVDALGEEDERTERSLAQGWMEK